MERINRSLLSIVGLLLLCSLCEPAASQAQEGPLTVAEAVYHGRFVEYTAPGHLLVHEWAAFATFVCGEGGPHRLGRTVRAEPFVRFLTEHLMPEASDYRRP